MGRQAPTPPKRTSSFRDSTYTDADHLPDDSGEFSNGRGGLGLNPLEGDSEPEELDDNLMGNTTSTFFPANQTAATSFQQHQSRRAAPVMGNRGLETQRISQERTRTKSKPGSKERSRESPRSSRKAQEGSSQVVALDERNLKRAVNRYGTMPKGARIGAYLESLRQSGMTPEPVTEQGVESDAVVNSEAHTSESMDRSMIGKPSKTSQMLRSNSSHGGFSANNGVSKSPSNNQVRRVQQGSLERSFGLSSAVPPPDFDFPPPPVDLPPPSPSPKTARKMPDKENLPERLERSSKRFRELSSDSCESLGTSHQVKSPMSPVSENRTLGSPAVGSLSSPGSTLDHDFKKPTMKSEDAIKPFITEKVQRNMESQLLAEMGQDKNAGDALNSEATGTSGTPADMLVSELFESFKAKSSKPTPKSLVEDHPSYENTDATQEIDFKANLRKVKKPVIDDEPSAKPTTTQIDFKSNLRKKSDPSTVPVAKPEPESSPIVDFKAKLRKSSKSEASSNTKEDPEQPVDFKARLRKVSGSKDKSSSSPTKEVIESIKADKRDSLGSADGAEELDDKRKSTGSISSLRKMWEASPKSNRTTQPPTDLDRMATTPSGDDGSDKTSTVKFEKRVWPPVPSLETEKPMVPVKPTVKPPAPTTKPPPPKEPLVKPPKPAMAVKPNVCNIYAAPTVATTRSIKPPIATRPQVKPSGSHEPQSGGSGCSSSEMSDKEELLGISQKLDSSIDQAKNSLNKSSLLKLSDDIGSFAESASGFVDNVPATGRFRFRSLLNKLEQQSGELRSSSVGKAHPSDVPAKLCVDIQATVRDLVSVINR